MTIYSITGSTLRRALRRLGWTQVGAFRNALQYWEPKSPDEAATASHGLDRLIVPSDDLGPDSADLITEASASLLRRYGREYSQTLDMIELMVKRHLDEVEVRRETGNRAGLIHWELGNEAINSTKGMLSASARASLAKMKRFGSTGSVVADEFLEQCYMGQTKVGSYVVTALTPAEADILTSRAQTPKGKPAPRIPGRSITDTLVSSLEAVRDAISEAREARAEGADEVFEMAVAEGVSFELLAALEPLTQHTESSVQVAYFRTESDDVVEHDETQRAPHEVIFTPEDSKVITQARQYFERNPEPKAMHLTGEVTDLKNSSVGSERRIKLATRINGKPRTVTVNLTPEQYARAVEAHGDERFFTVFGELETEARGSHVETPESVRVESMGLSDEIRSNRNVRSTATPESPLFD